MTTQDKEFHTTVKNEYLDIDVTQLPYCVVRFDIKVKPIAVNAVYHQAVKSIGKDVSIPGFRKGKAPPDMYQKKFGSAIQQEFIELLLNQSFNDAVNLTRNIPLKKEDSKIKPIVHECTYNKEAHFTIEFEAYPTVGKVDLNDLQFPRIHFPEITQADHENAVRNVLLSYATFEPIKDHPVQENDFINLTITFLEDPPRDVIKNQRTQVNIQGLPASILKLVIGLNEGDFADGEFIQSRSDFGDEETSSPCRVTIHSIWKGIIPNLDESFLQEIKAESLEEFHQKVDEGLNLKMAADIFDAESRVVEDLLLEKYLFDLPRTYIDRHVELAMNNYLENLEEGTSIDDEKYRQIEQMLEQDAMKRIRLILLKQKIAQDYDIKVEEEDLIAEFKKQIKASNFELLELDKDEHFERLRGLALERKIFEFLLNPANREEKS